MEATPAAVTGTGFYGPSPVPLDLDSAPHVKPIARRNRPCPTTTLMNVLRAGPAAS